MERISSWKSPESLDVYTSYRIKRCHDHKVYLIAEEVMPSTASVSPIAGTDSSGSRNNGSKFVDDQILRKSRAWMALDMERYEVWCLGLPQIIVRGKFYVVSWYSGLLDVTIV